MLRGLDFRPAILFIHSGQAYIFDTFFSLATKHYTNKKNEKQHDRQTKIQSTLSIEVRLTTLSVQ